jgi:hypothetical protein
MGSWAHGETLAVLVVAREVVQRQKHGGAEFRHGGALREQRCSALGRVQREGACPGASRDGLKGAGR